MSGNGNQVPLAPSQRGPGSHQSQQSVNDAAQSLQTSLNMSQSAMVRRIHTNQMHMQPLNNISLQFIPQPHIINHNHSTLKREQNCSRYPSSNRALPPHQYRVIAARPECYHPAGATGAAYMPSTAGGAQQAALRVQTAPQPSAPPAPQQDMSKTSMPGHNYVTPQTQAPPQTRPQYQNFQFRPTQHGNRPTSHPRQQQPFMQGASPTATGPVMYHPFVLPHMSLPPSYQQPRSSNPGSYYQFMPYITYTTPPSHTSPYYYPPNNHQQMATPNISANPPGARSNPTTMVGPQGTPATPAAPVVSLPQPQPPAHIHPPIPARSANLKTRDKDHVGIRPTQQKRPSHRVPIIDPVTQQDIFSDLYTNDQYSSESSERQTPQPETTHSIAEEFTRMVNEVANQPSAYDAAQKPNYTAKSADIPISTATSTTVHPHTNSIPSNNNNNIVKSDLLTVNENKVVGPDIAEEPIETPVVSALSDCPVIVPKLTKLHKSSEQIVQSIVVDKNVPSNKQHKPSKNKPVVPQNEEVDKSSEVVPAVVSEIAPVCVVAAIPAPASAPVTHIAPVPATAQVPAPAPAPMPASIQASATMPAPAQAPAPVFAQVPAPASAPVSVQAPAIVPVSTQTPAPTPVFSQPPPPVFMKNAAPSSVAALSPSFAPAPQPQRIREPRERLRSEEKDKIKDKEPIQEKEVPLTPSKPNGPINPVVISSIDSLPEVITPPTSLSSQSARADLAKNQVKQLTSAPETKVVETKIEQPLRSESPTPTPTQLLEASIEKVATKEPFTVPESIAEESKEESSAIQAQAKLTQSLASCLRTPQPDSKMKDINLNNKTTDPDTANGNPVEVAATEFAKEDANKNDKGLKTPKSNKKSANKMANNETIVKEAESFENGKDETDKIISNVDQEEVLSQTEEVAADTEPAEVEEISEEPEAPPAPVTPKYTYTPGQWSPMNTSGKKCYDIGLLRQLKEDPISKTKPDVPLLEVCNVMRTTPMQDTMTFAAISRPINDSLFPQFAKGSGIGPRSNTPRDPKKDGRNMPSGKGSTKMPSSAGSSGSHKPVIRVCLSLRDEVKLNETKDPWKPLRFKKDTAHEEESQTEELYKKFRGILNKLTPQKFDTLLEKVKTLEINNQKRLRGVIDLVFEKAIEEPNFSKAYAAMCNKLSMLKVPVDNATTPDQFVNFRALIISKCQNQFETDKVDEQVLKLEKDLTDCTDPAKKKELQLMLNEEQRRVRMRSVGNVRFIGELYKLKMLTAKIMVYCMTYLIDKLEEERLECLCKLLSTIGEQVESEVREPLDNVFKKMQEIVDRKNNKISSRVRFMIQDVIELRRRRWVQKSVVDSQPKMMDQIQKEAEQQQRNIELMNSSPGSGFGRRDDGGRGKRGGERRSTGGFMDSNQWKTTSRTNYTVDTSKLKAVTQKNLSNIKLAPSNISWNQGSGTKNTAQPGVGAASNSMISLSKNMYSVLENVQVDPATLRGNRDMTPNYHSKGASIERSTFNSRGDFNSGSRSGSTSGARSNSGSRGSSATPAPAAEPSPAPQTLPQEPLPDAKKKCVKSMIDLSLINPDDEEMVAEVKHQFLPQYHADVVTEILNVALEKAPKEVSTIAKSLLHIVSTNAISPDNFIAGMKEILEVAPDLYIDIPLLYDNLGKFVAPHIEKKHITLVQIFSISETIITSNHGHLLLKAIVKELKEDMGPSFVKSKWQESGLQLTEWMSEDQMAKWIEDNKFEFLEGGAKACEEAKKSLSPTETHKKLLELMNTDENCDCIKGWVHDNVGANANEEWFMRALIQAICEHALFGAEGRDVPHFNQDRMSKYSRLINEFGDDQQRREASCLFGIQQLIHRLEHPQGLSLEIFQYLHEQYIITPEAFMAWEESDLEPNQGKGVMMKALTSFFTNIKEAENEDSCSED